MGHKETVKLKFRDWELTHDSMLPRDERFIIVDEDGDWYFAVFVTNGEYVEVEVPDDYPYDDVNIQSWARVDF